MKQSDLSVGMEVVVTESTSDLHRRLISASVYRARVLAVGEERVLPRRPGSLSPTFKTSNDGVLVEWLDDAPMLGLRSEAKRNGKYGKGERAVIASRLIWMPWDEYLDRHANALRIREENEKRRAAVREHRDLIIARARQEIERVTDEVNPKFAVRVTGDSRIEVSLAALEALLDELSYQRERAGRSEVAS